MKSYKTVVIEGNIGVGKTTLANALGKTYNAKVILERFEDNPFLEKFYENPEQYAFLVEMNFLVSRYEQVREFLQPALFYEFSVSDFYLNKTMIFSSNNLTSHQYELFRKIYDIIYGKLPSPTIYIYLRRPVGELLQAIKKRGREYEKHITAEYLEGIEKAYMAYLRTVKDFPVVVVDVAGKELTTPQALEFFYELINDESLFSGVSYLKL
jgi:deoxyadenosine/deoxycytidine kinase